MAAATELSWSDEERAYLQSKGPIRVCVAPDWMPMEGLDANGRHTGLAADFLEVMAQRGGLQLQVQPTSSWEQSWAMALARECDIVPMLMQSPERLAHFDFTSPYLEIPGVVATLAEVPYVADIRQVLDRPLGHMRGFAGIELLHMRYPEIRLVEVDSYAEGLLRVASGELFGMLGNMASIGYALQESKATGLKIAGTIGSDSRMSVATRNDEPLLGRVFERLAQSIAPHERQQIMNRWLAVRFEHGFDYGLLWRVLVGVLLIGLAVAWWLAKLRRLNAQLREANRRLGEISRRDALTGLYNRTHFEDRFEAILRMCRRNGLPLGLAMLDVDHFKEINDRHGHPFGDEVLRVVAKQLGSCFRRETDTVIRLGGDEFLVIGVGGTREEFFTHLDAYRRAIEATPIRHGKVEAAVSVTIGACVTVPGPGDRAEDLLACPDVALYRAKRNGRNRVELIEPGSAEPAAEPA